MQNPSHSSTVQLRRLVRRLSIVLGAMLACFALAGSAFALTMPPNYNLVFSDYNMRNYNSMSAAQIQAYLNTQTGPLHDYSAPRHDNGAVAPASVIIWEACQQWKISPKAMLALLQKEQSLLTRTSLATNTLARAIGAGCPDATTNKYPGFGNQMWYGAKLLDSYGEVGKTFTSYVPLFYPGIHNAYMPSGISPVNIATYKLYVYNPSTTGNGNFYGIYLDRFGNPTGGVDSVTAVIDSVSPSVWASTGSLVTFKGHGADGVGHGITEYKWRTASGVLSTAPSFSTSSLPLGINNLFFSARCSGGVWSAEAFMPYVVGAANTKPLPVYRFWNTRANTYLYTASESERQSIQNSLSSTYALEGVGYALDDSAAANDTPLYRWRNVINGCYFYSASPAEQAYIDANLSSVLHFEGPAYDVSPTQKPGTYPVFRFRNKNTGSHFYTNSTVERDTICNTLLGTYDWEGVAFYYAQPW